MRITLGGSALLLGGLAWAQESQFTFDPNGNLLSQSAENLALPQILAQPQPQVVGPGELASFFVVVADTRELTYQWRFNGTNVSGGTNDTLLLTNVGTNNEGQYSVVLVNGSGSVTSNPAMLWFDSNGNGLPDTWEMTYFGNLNQTATGDFDHDGVSNLQEFLDGTNPTNSASALYQLVVITDGGSVTLSPSRLRYTNGEVVTLTATASSPGVFRFWSGAISTTNNPATVVMDTNKTVIAFLGASYDVTWTNEAGGDWNVATNWSPNFVPLTNDNVILTRSTVTLNTSTACLSLTLGSGNTAPTLTGSGDLTVRGPSTWMNGSMTGSGRTIIAPGATLNMVVIPSQLVLNGRVLENGGTILASGSGGVALTGGAVITNRAGALFEAQSSPTVTSQGGACRFDNAGTFRKSADGGTVVFNAFSLSTLAFNNYGAVDLQAGTLQFNVPFLNSASVTLSPGTTNQISGGGSANGVFTAPATSLAVWSGNSFTLDPGVQFNGNGLYRFLTVTLACDADVGVANLDVVGPSLTGAGTITVGNLMNWPSGTLGGSGRIVISPGATLNLGSSSQLVLNGRVLENAGTILESGSGGLVLTGGAVITNRAGAMFELQSSPTIFASGGACRFDNAGTFRKSLDAGTITFNLCCSATLPFNNYGIVDIQRGILAVNGGYNSSGSALLNCALGGTIPGTNYGQLQVAGTVTLNGALSVGLTNGFMPGNNDSFTVLSAGTRSGTFSSFSYPSNQSTMLLSNTPNSVVVRSTGPYFLTSAQLPDAMKSVGYTQQVFGAAGPLPVTFALASGSLPAGLTISSAGVISGIPTVSGSNTFALRITDASGNNNQQTFNLRVLNMPPAGLISWWRAENNALDSISTNHGVLTNGATFAPGMVGQTFALDGVNDYVQVADSQSLRPASVTLEAWVKFFATNGIRSAFCKAFGSGPLDSYALVTVDGIVYGLVADSSGFGPFLTSPAAVATNQWYHLAYTFDDASKQQVLYVNGVAVTNSTANKTISYDTHPLLLGADIENGVLNYFHNGQIDEPSIYNRALTSNEIAAIYAAGSAGKPANVPYFTSPGQLPDAVQMVGYTQQLTTVLGTNPISLSVSAGAFPTGLTLNSSGLLSGVPAVAGTFAVTVKATDAVGAFSEQLFNLRVVQPAPAPAGMIAWWRAEGNALDAVSTNHGTASNGVLYAESKVGQAFSFDGVDDYVNIPDSPALRPASLTLETWTMLNASNGAVIARPYGPGISDSWAIWVLNGNINGTIADTNQNADILTSPSTLVTGQWYHVAYTFDDVTKQQRLYLNGAVVAAGQTLRAIGYDTHPVVLGGDIENGSPGFFFNGRVDEAAIYNRALTTNEVLAIYNAGSAGKHLLTPLEQWKLTYLGDFYASDTADPDGDGFNNLAEYIADTNPTNALSNLRITAAASVPAGFALQWQGGTLSTQWVQRSFSLGPGSWQDIFTNLPPTPNPSSFTDLTGTNAAQFYRIRVAR